MMTMTMRYLAPIGLLLGSASLVGLASGEPSGRWIGQDGHDLVGTFATPGRSDIQDIHFVLSGLPAGAKVVAATVHAEGGGEWKLAGPPGSWLALILKADGASIADAYIEPYQVEKGRSFDFQLTFDDGRSMTIWVRGGKADPNLRMVSARMVARWVGQDRRDLVPSGPNAGPDGVQDTHIALSRIAPKGEVRSVLIAGPGELRWQFGPNHEALARAELVRDPSDPGRADLFFQPTRDLAGQSLKISLTYADGKVDSATLSAREFDPSLKMDRRPPAFPMTIAVKSTWLGQGGAGGRLGDIRVSLEGLPSSGRIVGVDLGDGEVAGWSDRSPSDIPEALPLTFRRGADPSRAELAFPPVRDESGASMSLRLVFSDGRSTIASFPGGPCDPTLRAEPPPDTRISAKPGDDLNDLADRHGTVNLAAGIYTLSRPLVLDHPITITSESGAEIRFAQGPDEPAWTAAIKIHSGRTTLDHLTIRFAGPVRWDSGVGYGPAVIGTTDDRDRPTGRVLAGLKFARLDVQGPPPSSTWEEAPKTMRLLGATNGVIERSRIRGGMIELWSGPWKVSENAFEGTNAGTFTHTMIAAHEPHGLLISGNEANPVDPLGKSWRWLVLTNRGTNVKVVDNRVEHVGPRDDDKVEHPNAPETILTESYRLYFEGKTIASSPDGRIVSIPPPQGGPAKVGSVVAILSGPEAGRWRRVALPLGPETYLLDRPLSLGGGAIAIAPGFVSTCFEGNMIDDRGSKVAVPIVLAGNHYGTSVARNRTLGGNRSVRIVAATTEAPGPWGWSHNPIFGMVVEGNLFEDAWEGAILGVEHNHLIRPSRGRVYMTATLAGNTFIQSGPFLSTVTRANKGVLPPGLEVGEKPSGDPGELEITESGNRSRGGRSAASARVHMAVVNGRSVSEGEISFPEEAKPTANEDASKRR